MNLQGLLGSISLSEVVQLLHAGKKMGELRVWNGGVQGVLYLHAGEVVRAELGRSTGESAAFQALEWESGEFEFVATQVKPGGNIRRSVPDLLMESARTLDTRRRMRTFFPDLSAVPWTFLPEPVLTHGLNLSADDRMIIPHFDGYKDFRQVLAHSMQSELPVLQVAHTLLEAGRLQLFEPAVVARVVPMKTGMFKKGDHVEMNKTSESRWRGLQPYSHGQIARVLIQWVDGEVREPIQFNSAMEDGVIAVPSEFMAAWTLGGSDAVVVRPAP